MINTSAMQKHQHGNNLEYKGKIQEYQLYGEKKYTSIYTFNSYQKFLYNRAMFGLSVYSEQEIKDMTRVKRKRILRVHKNTKKIINLWKQEIIIALTDHLFKTFFPKMPLTQELETFTEDDTFNCALDIKELVKDKREIVSKLLENGILPKNFYQLKTT